MLLLLFIFPLPTLHLIAQGDWWVSVELADCDDPLCWRLSRGLFPHNHWWRPMLTFRNGAPAGFCRTCECVPSLSNGLLAYQCSSIGVCTPACVSVQEQKRCASMTICEIRLQLSTSHFFSYCSPCTDKNNPHYLWKESIISLFQSSLVSLLGVNELRFHHRYQRHSLFNYSYWACSVRHCCLESIFFFLFFFCLHAAWRCVEWQPKKCSCTLLVHKLLDCRKRMGSLSPCLLTQRSISSVEHNVKL